MNKVELIKNYILQNYPTASDDISGDTDLIETGILDSMGIIELVSYLEKEFSLSFPDDDITVDNFGSIDKIVSYLATHNV